MTKIYALVSDQGTAMDETVLTSDEYGDDIIRRRGE